MGRVVRSLAAGILLCHATAAFAQQGSVQVFGAAQGLTGDAERFGSQSRFDPDFGVTWLQPGSRLGTFHLDARGTKRGDRFHIGRVYLAADRLPAAGLTWTLEAGDAYYARSIRDYRFTNLTAPTVTFSGGAVTGRGRRGGLQVVGGRATAWRNIFGSDPDTLGQTLAIAHGDFKLNDRLDLLGRASRVKTSDLREFNFTIADSRQGGGGLRYIWTPAVQLVADGSFVQYRRAGSSTIHRDGSFLAGANLLLARGWAQINVSRFSPGDFPALNNPLLDRETVFAAGEYDVRPRIQLFGGLELFRTNVDPDLDLDPARDTPRSVTSRGFGGVRVQVAARSLLSLRAEEGAAAARPVRGGLETEMDSGNWSAEWQTTVGRLSSHTRVSWRENIARSDLARTFNQRDLSSQLFVTLSRNAQVFGSGSVTRFELVDADESSYWQIGGGAQVQLPRQALWLRGEAITSRNVNLITGEFVPREALNIGLNGQLSPRTSLSFNLAADRVDNVLGTGSPWTTRSMIRVTQSFSTGSARVPTAMSAAAGARPRGTATVLGTIYADWNANGAQDPGEEPLAHIPVRIAAVTTITTAGNGEFAFLNVPAGPQEVGLDTAAVPVDYDLPAVSQVDLDLERGATRRLSFGLIPLGTVRGRVIQDANGNGRVDPGEEPVEGAVLVLDNGSRSERARTGTFRFDAVRSGQHVVSLLRESLPDGAVVVSEADVPVSVGRNQLVASVDFLVVLDKRPENRRVFPSRLGEPSPESGASARPGARNREARAPAARPAATARGGSAPARPPVRPSRPALAAPERYAVQVAALRDAVRARTLAGELEAAGYRAYVVTPAEAGHDGLHRVRVGAYGTRAAAVAAAAKLGRTRNEKLWVLREPR